jgi:hypothetical protein
MKIEIAENLIYSYLKHVEGCRIVQTNWKTSNQWTITEHDKILSKELFAKFKQSISLSGIFKKYSFEQLIRQAEIDVLGINPAEKSVFGIDIAFHSAGVNYGNKNETNTRIVKKILRTVLIMQSYFSEFEKVNSYFIAPKTNRANVEPILDLINEANEIIGDEMITISFITNDDFFEGIVEPTIKRIDEDNDTSELFIRSIKLIQLDKRKKLSEYSKKSKSKHIVQPNNLYNTEKKEVNNMKIGQFVQHSMRDIYNNKLITDEELERLQNIDYSNKVFRQNLEILRHKSREISGADGRNRYYARELFFGDYHLTSQWVEKHWEPFLSWLEEIKKTK